MEASHVIISMELPSNSVWSLPLEKSNTFFFIVLITHTTKTILKINNQLCMESEAVSLLLQGTHRAYIPHDCHNVYIVNCSGF